MYIHVCNIIHTRRRITKRARDHRTSSPELSRLISSSIKSFTFYVRVSRSSLVTIISRTMRISLKNFALNVCLSERNEEFDRRADRSRVSLNNSKSFSRYIAFKCGLVQRVT